MSCVLVDGRCSVGALLDMCNVLTAKAGSSPDLRKRSGQTVAVRCGLDGASRNTGEVVQWCVLRNVYRKMKLEIKFPLPLSSCLDAWIREEAGVWLASWRSSPRKVWNLRRPLSEAPRQQRAAGKPARAGGRERPASHPQRVWALQQPPSGGSYGRGG